MEVRVQSSISLKSTKNKGESQLSYYFQLRAKDLQALKLKVKRKE